MAFATSSPIEGKFRWRKGEGIGTPCFAAALPLRSAHARAPPAARERFALLSVSHERPVTDFLTPKNTRARVYGVGPKVAGSGCPAVRRRIES